MYRVVDISSDVQVYERRIVFTQELLNAKIAAINHFLYSCKKDNKYSFNPTTVVKRNTTNVSVFQIDSNQFVNFMF